MHLQERSAGGLVLQHWNHRDVDGRLQKRNIMRTPETCLLTLADGSYTLCGIGEHVPEMLFGHAARNHLGDVWRESPVLGEIRDGMPHRLEGVCGECVLRKMCMGACIAQNYYTHKNLWSAFWYCEEASHIGLFPEMRRLERNPRWRVDRGESHTSMAG